MTIEAGESPEAIKAIAQENIVDLDVRPTLKAGGEPFSAIMAAVETIPAGGAFRLRATFEPKPLYRVLGGKGWKHWVEFGQADDWMIWFYKDSEPEFPVVLDATVSQYPELSKRLKTTEKEWTLDVRELSPPEPMEMTLAVLNHLPKEVRLKQINQRVPQFLIPLLEERGFESAVLSETDTEVQIEIKYR